MDFWKENSVELMMIVGLHDNVIYVAAEFQIRFHYDPKILDIIDRVDGMSRNVINSMIRFSTNVENITF